LNSDDIESMKTWIQFAAKFVPAVAVAALVCTPARAQDPLSTPVIVSIAAPIVIKALTPKPSGLGKFEGFVMNANTVQITVRAKGDDMSVQTFTLSEEASARMQQAIDKGGYQWGDKVTVLYDPTSRKAVRIKGKPSRAL
jgi:hypothetical protein